MSQVTDTIVASAVDKWCELRGENWISSPQLMGHMRAVIEAILPLINSAGGGEGKAVVKPLEWTKRDLVMSVAETPLGTYRVWTYYQSGSWFWNKLKSGLPDHHVASEADGKAAAFADYETRIRSALYAAPLAQPVATAGEREKLIERLGKTRDALNDAGYFGESPEGPGDPEVRALDEAISALRPPLTQEAGE